jgi:hypothetical protein
MPFSGEFLGNRLIISTTLRTEQDYPGSLPGNFSVLYRRRERFGLHYHTLAATKGPVIGHCMRPIGKASEVNNIYTDLII